jgi:hypothetical protein
VAEDIPITVYFDGEGTLIEFPAESVTVGVPPAAAGRDRDGDVAI